MSIGKIGGYSESFGEKGATQTTTKRNDGCQHHPSRSYHPVRSAHCRGDGSLAEGAPIFDLRMDEISGQPSGNTAAASENRKIPALFEKRTHGVADCTSTSHQRPQEKVHPQKSGAGMILAVQQFPRITRRLQFPRSSSFRLIARKYRATHRFKET